MRLIKKIRQKFSPSTDLDWSGLEPPSSEPKYILDSNPSPTLPVNQVGTVIESSVSPPPLVDTIRQRNLDDTRVFYPDNKTSIGDPIEVQQVPLARQSEPEPKQLTPSDMQAIPEVDTGLFRGDSPVRVHRLDGLS